MFCLLLCYCWKMVRWHDERSIWQTMICTLSINHSPHCHKSLSIGLWHWQTLSWCPWRPEDLPRGKLRPRTVLAAMLSGCYGGCQGQYLPSAGIATPPRSLPCCVWECLHTVGRRTATENTESSLFCFVTDILSKQWITGTNQAGCISMNIWKYARRPATAIKFGSLLDQLYDNQHSFIRKHSISYKDVTGNWIFLFTRFFMWHFPSMSRSFYLTDNSSIGLLQSRRNTNFTNMQNHKNVSPTEVFLFVVADKNLHPTLSFSNRDLQMLQ